jgi:hypothetical protein
MTSRQTQQKPAVKQVNVKQPATKTTQKAKNNNTNNGTAPAKPILRIDPAKKAINDAMNANLRSKTLNSTQHPIPHNQTLPAKQKRKEAQKEVVR